MSRFRKKPEPEVEAVQCMHDGIPTGFLRDDENTHRLPDGSYSVRRNGKGQIAEVPPGDWLIREPDGFLATCWQRYFAEAYEPADQPTTGRWAIWVCPECGEQVSESCGPPMLPARGHRHDNPEKPFGKRIFHQAEEITVVPADQPAQGVEGTYTREQLLSDDVIETLAREAESRWAYPPGDPAHALVRSSIRREIEAACDALDKGKGGDDG